MKADVRIVGSSFWDNFHIIKNGKYQDIRRKGGIYNIENFTDYYSTETNIARYLVCPEHETIACCEWETDWINTIRLQKDFKAAPKKADWIHFMYANTIPQLNIKEFEAEVKSCDLSNGPRPDISVETTLENAEACDIIFVSSHYEHIKELLERCRHRMIISHSETGSTVHQHGCIVASYYHPREKFMYVTGAGDKFAGFFIEDSIKGYDLTIKDQLEYAHQNTLAWLRKVNSSL